MRRAFGNLIFERCTTEEVKLSGAGSLLKTRTDGRRRGLKTEWSLEKLLKRVPKVQCSDAESLRQKDRVKKDTEEKQPRNKKAVRRNEKIPEARFFAVFSIRAMFCRKSPAGDGIFFLKTVRMCDPHRSDHTSNGKGEKKMDALNQAIAQISDVLWNSVLLFLLVGTGVYFSVRTRFVQVRKFKTAWNRVFGGFSLKGKKAGKDGMTSFQALATAIAAQVGTGNIAGCATALVSGGPGAIFWMWLAAFFGMATIYGEAYLAQISKRRDESGEIIGGPVYYITHAFKGTFGKALAGFFAVAVILALGFMGNMVQSNSISDAFYTAFSVPKWVMGVIVAVLAAFIFIGGISRIASFTEKVVPVMAALYLVGALVVILINIQHVPSAIASIFICAFRPDAVFGAAAGITVRKAMRYGVARGLFSNEAGMGSAPNVAATAHVTHPVKQGLIQTLGVFTDTLIICTCTAFIILFSGAPLDGSTNGVQLTQQALTNEIGSAGSIFVAIALFFFAFSSILGNYYYGEANVRYLTRKKWILNIYRILVGGMVLFGALAALDVAWSLADVTMGLMALCNLIAISLLGKYAFKLLEDYRAQKRAGIKDPVFTKDRLKEVENDIECW